MSRLNTMSSSLLLLLVLTTACLCSPDHHRHFGGHPSPPGQPSLGAGKQPNIVFVLADDYGYNDIGYHGNQIPTPNLVSLASEGVRLENYYVQPICTPTRSCLMSGRYQIHTGLSHGIIKHTQPNALPDDSKILPEKMKEAGYATHMVGKWHLGFYKEKYLPYNRGFDTYFGYYGGSEDYYNHTKVFSQSQSQYLDLHDQNGPIWSEQGHYSTEMFTERAIDVINKHEQTKPLFLYMAYQSVHSPLQVPERYEAMFDNIEDTIRRTYAGMVTAMDEGIGNITQALKDKDLWNNTIFIFSTDNGGKPQLGGNNYPLRGEKSQLWEGGIHGIGFVSGGVVRNKGVVNNELIHVTDWFPTLVGVAGGNTDGTKPLDGYDQWDMITKGSPSKRTVLLHNIDTLYQKSGVPLYNDTFDTSIRAAVRVGDMKLITGRPGAGVWQPLPIDNVTTLHNQTNYGHGRWHSTHGGNLTNLQPHNQSDTNAFKKNVWLFNITADPSEREDLSENMPEEVRKLLGYLEDFQKTAVTPRFPANDPKADPSLHGDVWGPWVKDDTDGPPSNAVSVGLDFIILGFGLMMAYCEIYI